MTLSYDEVQILLNSYRQHISDIEDQLVAQQSAGIHFAALADDFSHALVKVKKILEDTDYDCVAARNRAIQVVNNALCD